MSNQYDVTEADHIFLLKYIKTYLRTYGYAPTFRELVEPLGLSSTCPVQGRVKVLEERGWIQRTPRIARSTRITRKGHRAIKEHDDRIKAATQVIGDFNEV